MNQKGKGSTMVHAFCYASGEIGISEEGVPKGALPIAHGRKDALVIAISELATRNIETDGFRIPHNKKWDIANNAGDYQRANDLMLDEVLAFQAKIQKRLEQIES